MRRLLRKHRYWLAPGALFTLAALCFLLSGPGRAVTAAAIDRQLPIYCVQKDSKVISVSFDAAWGNEDTQNLIDVLGHYGVKATFFVVKQWADKYPESVSALHEAGHEVMNHSSTHPYFTKLTRQQMIDEVTACDDRIEAITGVRPVLFRPPYGDYNDAVIDTLRSIGHYPIQWDVEASAASSGALIQRGLDRCAEGAHLL